MKNLRKTIIGALVCGMCLASAFADAKGTEIIQKVIDFKKPTFSQSQVIMTLTDKNGSEEKRQIVEYGKESDGKTYAVMDFKGPASVKDTRFLQISGNGSDDKWIYLPSLKSVRRVNSSEGSKSFMGTDATYDDLSTRQIDEDDHQYVREEKFTVENGNVYDCYVVKEVPYDKKSSQYSSRLVWVDKATMYDKPQVPDRSRCCHQTGRRQPAGFCNVARLQTNAPRPRACHQLDCRAPSCPGLSPSRCR